MDRIKGCELGAGGGELPAELAAGGEGHEPGVDDVAKGEEEDEQNEAGDDGPDHDEEAGALWGGDGEGVGDEGRGEHHQQAVDLADAFARGGHVGAVEGEDVTCDDEEREDGEGDDEPGGGDGALGEGGLGEGLEGRDQATAPR